MLQFKVLVNVLIVTCVIGLAISYLTSLFPTLLPHLNFLEAVGVYCLWVPIHQTISGGGNGAKSE
jgi:hypothetical protein